MEQILIVRETIVKFYKRYETLILPILKFLLGLFVFSSILSIGQMHTVIEPIAENWSPRLLSVLLALLFTVMPMNMGWILIILSLTVQFSANIEIAVAVFLFLLFVFVFYARMALKESILILFTIMAFHFNVPYLIPIIAGLYFPITSIIPIILGVFINAQIPVLFGLAQHTPTAAGAMADMEIAELLTELPEAFSIVHETLMHSLTVSRTGLFTAVIFAMVIVLVHFVSRLSIDFAKEIAIALGCVINIFGFIVAVLIAGENANIGLVIVLTILCGILAGFIRCFDAILDYQRAESVQFEDDNNYYHVRIVPKVILTKSKRVVKRIRPQSEADFPSDDDRPVTARRPRPAGHTGALRQQETGARRPRPSTDMPQENIPPVRRRPLPKPDED